MEAFLSNIRTAHLLLIAITIAAAVFCFTPRDYDLYHSARLEAEFLSGIPDTAYPRSLHRLQEQASRSGIASVDAILSRPPFQFQAADSRWRGGLSLMTRWPTEKSTVRDIVKILNTDPFIQVLTFEPESSVSLEEDDVGFDLAFGKKNVQLSGRCLAYSEKQERDVRVRCSPVLPGAVFEEVRSVDRKTYETLGDVLNVPSEYSSFGANRLVMQITNPGEDSEPAEYLLSSADAKSLPSEIVGKMSYKNWLIRYYLASEGIKHKDNLWVSLFVNQRHRLAVGEAAGIFSYSTDDFGMLFSSLAALYREVGEMTPKEALGYLRGKEQGAKKDMSLAGQAVDYRIMYLVGPVAMFMVLVYLVYLVGSARQAAQKLGARKDYLGYPWFALSRDPLARLLTSVTLILAPSLVTLMALLQSSTEPGPFLILALALMLLNFYLGSLVSRHCLRLSILLDELSSVLIKAEPHVAFRRRVRK